MTFTNKQISVPIGISTTVNVDFEGDYQANATGTLTATLSETVDPTYGNVVSGTWSFTGSGTANNYDGAKFGLITTPSFTVTGTISGTASNVNFYAEDYRFNASGTLDGSDVLTLTANVFINEEFGTIGLQQTTSVGVTHTLPPIISIDHYTASVLESAGSISVTLARSGADLSAASKVFLSTQDGTALSTGSHPNYVAVTNQEIDFAAGQSSVTVTLPIILNYNEPGPNETFNFSLSNPVNASLGFSTGSVTIIPPTVDSTAAAIQAFNSGQLSAGTLISDSAADIATNLSTLQQMAAAGKLAGITLTDGGTPNLTINTAQLVNDATALGEISGNFTVTISPPNSSQTVPGVASHANIQQVSATASEASFVAAGNGTSVTANIVIPGVPGTADGGNRYSLQLSNVTEVSFTDHSVIIAATPGQGSVTSGNITEIYGAVFGREPDVAGLVFYQNYAAVHPGTPLLQYAQWFLASGEYTGNAAHNYAQTVAGDQQFITDSYSNLLHRTPSADEVAFYENKVVAKALAGLTAGTAAYTTADAAAHAQTLVYFSASAEFLGDVEVTAQNPASAQHWLVLI